MPTPPRARNSLGSGAPNCHVIDNKPSGGVPQDPPTFSAIAHSGMTGDQLRAFLSHPHGAMPDLDLTRAGIDDLTPAEFRRYGSARTLYNFKIENVGAY